MPQGPRNKPGIDQRFLYKQQIEPSCFESDRKLHDLRAMETHANPQGSTNTDENEVCLKIKTHLRKPRKICQKA